MAVHKAAAPLVLIEPSIKLYADDIMNKPVKAEQQPKKSYDAPKLIRHGDLRSLTRSGTGSAKEPVNSGNGSPQKFP
jgi:hypothetical protein